MSTPLDRSDHPPAAPPPDPVSSNPDQPGRLGHSPSGVRRSSATSSSPSTSGQRKTSSSTHTRGTTAAGRPTSVRTTIHSVASAVSAAVPFVAATGRTRERSAAGKAALGGVKSGVLPVAPKVNSSSTGTLCSSATSAAGKCEPRGKTITTPPSLSSDKHVPFRGNPHQFIQLTIATMTGKTFPLRVLPTDTLWELKRFIAQDHGIPVESQTLLLRDRPLRDSNMVCDYNLKTGDKLDLVLTLAGGHGPITASLKLPFPTSSTSSAPGPPSLNLSDWFPTSPHDARDRDNHGDSPPSVLLLLCRQGDDLYLLELLMANGQCVDARAQYLGGSDLAPEDVAAIVRAMGPQGNGCGPASFFESFASGGKQGGWEQPQGEGGGSEEEEIGDMGLMYDDGEPIEYPVDECASDRPGTAESMVSIPDEIARKYGLLVCESGPSSGQQPSNDVDHGTISPHLESVIHSAISQAATPPSSRPSSGKPTAKGRPTTAIALTRVGVRPLSAGSLIVKPRAKSAPVDRFSLAMVSNGSTEQGIREFTTSKRARSRGHVLGAARKPPAEMTGEQRPGSGKRQPVSARQQPPRQTHHASSHKPSNAMCSLPTIDRLGTMTTNASSAPTARRRTPPGSGRTQAPSTRTSAVPPPAPTNAPSTCACRGCSKRLRPAMVAAGATRCRCGGHFCAKHRTSGAHECTYDYRAVERARLLRENPSVTGRKVPGEG